MSTTPDTAPPTEAATPRERWTTTAASAATAAAAATAKLRERARAHDAAWQGRPMAERQPTLPVLQLQLAGDQRQMGAQHGEMTRAAGGWEATVDWYPGMAARMVAGKRVHPAQRGVPLMLDPIGAHLLERLHRRRPEELRARSEAFFCALGRSPQQARTLAEMDLLQNVIGGAGRFGLGGLQRRWSQLVPGACSTLAVWGDACADGGMLIGRNFDFPGAGCWESAPTVVFCTPERGLRYGFVATRGADAPCVSVWNEAGLVVTIHTRLHRHVRFDARIAVDLVHEIVRTCSTLAEAVAVARRAPVASTWGLIVASAIEGRAQLIEIHGEHVEVTSAHRGESFVASTNRYQAPSMHEGELDLSPGWLMHSDGRHLALRRAALAAVTRGGMAPMELAALLGSHEDPEDPGSERLGGGVLAQLNAVHSVVIDPIGQRTWLSVGAVPTGHGPWLEVPWAWQDTPSSQEVDVQALREAHQADLQAPGARFRHGALGTAHGLLLEAGRLEAAAAPESHIAAALYGAVAAAPEERTLNLLAGGQSLRDGELARALGHFEIALDGERSPFYRARALLWVSRAAAASGDDRLAQAARADLAKVAHPRTETYLRSAWADGKRGFDAARARGTEVAVQLCDLSAPRRLGCA